MANKDQTPAPEFLESAADISNRIVMNTMRALFEVTVRPNFPLISWEDCPRRIMSSLYPQAYVIAGAAISEYEDTLKMNGFQIPSILHDPDRALKDLLEAMGHEGTDEDKD